MALQDITITGSIGTYPTLSYGQKMYVSSTDEESFPIEKAIGSNGGLMPNLYGQTSSIGLFSPINQQWSGSILTSVGIVDYIHSSQDEFINGELSGSALEVSHQSLVDKDCEVYLTVDTTPTNYKPFIYNAIDTPLSLGNFLNANTSPNNGEIYIFDNKIIVKEKEIKNPVPPYGPLGATEYTFGGSINYIKVNRFDIEGEDNTLSLQELTNLRIKFSDLGIVDFSILTITEYPTYYLFLVNKPITYANPYVVYYEPFFGPGIPPFGPPVPPATPYTVDNNVLNYTLSASSNTNQTDSLKFNSSTGNSLGYLDLPTGIYTLGNTPNATLILSASAVVFTNSIGTLGTELRVYRIVSGSGSRYGTTGFSYTSANLPAGGSATLYISGSFVPLANESYIIGISDDVPGDADITASLSSLSITAVLPTHTSSNLTVLEPYLTEDFYYNDCNVLYGNALNLEYDSAFYQVNYDEGSVIPSNQAQIINGTAELAPVKAYNYALRAQINPRYVGTRVVQQNENVWTRGDISPSQTPSVQTLGTYFAYFEFAGATNPEIINKRGFKIKFLIDTSGSIIQPTLNEDIPYYNNLIDSFPGGKNVNIVPYTLAGDVSQIQGIQSVYQPGALPKPLLYNQITSNDVITSSISFTGIAGVPNYNTSLALTPLALYPSGPFDYNILDINVPSSPTQILFSSETIYNSSGTDRNLEILNSTATTQLVPILTIDLRVFGFPFNPAPGFATLSILKESSGVWTVIATQNITIPSNAPQTFTLTASPQVITATNKYRVKLSSPGVAFGRQVLQSGGTFTLGQTTPPSSLTLTAPYWTTGSLSSNILTGSIQMNSGVYGLTQTAVTGSGYVGSLPFTVQRLDQIRFSADENQVYQVLEVLSPLDSIDGRLYLTLDRNIVSGTNLASFFLRRMDPDAGWVIINVPAAGGGLSGFIYPEHITKELSSNLSSIITKLQQENLIQ
jgi:hypothetical protein